MGTVRAKRLLLDGPTFRRRLVTTAVFGLFMACGQPTIRVVDTPENVLAIQHDVVAFQMGGKRARAYDMRLPVEALGAEAQRADSLLLLRYTAGDVAPVARLAQGKESIYQLQGGEMYLLYALPTGRLRATYDALCTLTFEHDYVERVIPGIFDRLCPLILCAPEADRFEDLVGQVPGAEQMLEGFDFGGGPIGGYGPPVGPGGPCEACTAFRPGNVTPTLTCGGGGSPAAPSGCSTILFTDDFQADAVGSPPSTNPQPNPPTDMLVLQSGPNDIRVIASAPLGSRAVQIDRGSSATGNSLTGIVEGGPHASGRYRATFKAYGIADNTTSGVVVSAQDPAGNRAFRIIFHQGNLSFVTGSGATSAGTYTLGTPQDFLLEVDLDAGTVSLAIDGSPIGSGPFLDSTFADMNRLVIEHGQAILEAFPWELVVDDAQICRL